MLQASKAPHCKKAAPSDFIVKCIMEMRNYKEYQDQWISAENMVHLIKHHLVVPASNSFDSKRLNFVTSKHPFFLAAGIESCNNWSPHGVYRHCKSIRVQNQ